MSIKSTRILRQEVTTARWSGGPDETLVAGEGRVGSGGGGGGCKVEARLLLEHVKKEGEGRRGGRQGEGAEVP